MDINETMTIARKWAKRLGYGFHLDTRGENYHPPLSRAEIDDYESDMERLFTADDGIDPYECGIAALEELIMFNRRRSYV